MAKEIERKFLVDINNDTLKRCISESIKTNIAQGYLLNTPQKVVRVRCSDIVEYEWARMSFAHITIKSATENALERNEWEYEIPTNDAKEMLKLCGDFVIEKTRYSFRENDNLFWEVDVFHGYNDGLIVAEIELPTKDTQVDLPDWIVSEVTYDPKYSNNNLTICPFTKWI